MALFGTPDPPKIEAPPPPATPEADPNTAARARRAIESRRVGVDDLIINPAVAPSPDFSITPRT